MQSVFWGVWLFHSTRCLWAVPCLCQIRPVWMDGRRFIHSPVDGRLNCFQVLAIIVISFLVAICILLGTFLAVELPGHMVNVCLISVYTTTQFSKMV